MWKKLDPGHVPGASSLDPPMLNPAPGHTDGIHVEVAYSSFSIIRYFLAKSWQNPASIDREEQNKKISPPQVRIESTTSRSSF